MLYLAGLVTELMEVVPVYNETPTPNGYQLCVKDAIVFYGERRSLTRYGTLTVVSGTAAYDLPTDFLEMIQLETPADTSGVLISSDGIIPLGDDSPVTVYAHEIIDGTLTFFTTPTWTASLDYIYRAGYALDENQGYPSLTDRDRAVFMRKAYALALAMQGAKAARDAWTYSLGDERVDKTRQSEAFLAHSKEYEAEFEVKLAAAIAQSSKGMRSKYTAVERSWLTERYT